MEVIKVKEFIEWYNKEVQFYMPNEESFEELPLEMIPNLIENYYEEKDLPDE